MKYVVLTNAEGHAYEIYIFADQVVAVTPIDRDVHIHLAGGQRFRVLGHIDDIVDRLAGRNHQ